MKVFSPLYNKAMIWARHRRAPWYLAALSTAESSFFPIPPDVMLAPMCLAKPYRAWWLATLTTVTSVIGGILGYLLGLLAFDLVEPWLHRVGYWEYYLQVKDWFARYGFWAVFMAGFSPIPYKMFTITAGVISMAIPPFILASIIGRGGRFFLVAGLMRWGGARMEGLLRKYVDRIGWVMVALVILVFVLRH